MKSRRFLQGVESLIRCDLTQLEAYQPIVPLEVLSQRLGIPIERIIKLDGNENPFGCSPRVMRALVAYPSYHIYPDPDQNQVREALEGYVGVGMEHIVMGSGSDELIDLVLRLFIEPGDEVIICEPTFGYYSFSVGVSGGKVVNVPRKADYSLNIESIKAAIGSRTKVIFIASPNNPTGNICPESDILELAGTGVVVVVDEAYYEFSGATVAPLVPKHDNLTVLRSFSKWAGLAGLRVGYGIFPAGIAQHLLKIKPPYNVNVAAQVAVQESLADIGYLQGIVRAIIAEREQLFARLKGLEFLEPLPSRANFILCSVLKGEAREICKGLEAKGILVRYFDRPLLRNSLRISVGLPAHTDALIEALLKLVPVG